MFAAETLLTQPDDEEDTSGDLPTASETSEGSELSAEQLKRHLEHLRPEDFGKFNL
jgi:hypothetical protein